MSRLACTEDFSEILHLLDPEDAISAAGPTSETTTVLRQLIAILSQFHIFCRAMARDGMSETCNLATTQVTAEEVRRTLFNVPADQWKHLLPALAEPKALTSDLPGGR